MSETSINSIPQILGSDHLQWGAAIAQAMAGLRVCLPGIIQSFDPVKQTVVVQCAIQETVKKNGVMTPTTIPLLLDVPIVLPRAGGFTLTLPIAQGDECLVFFADLNINSWWQSGGVQPRMDGRRHDFSDAFAIPGPWSQPRVLSSYATDSVQLRRDDGSAQVEISAAQIGMIWGNAHVNITSDQVEAIRGDGKIDITDNRILLVWGASTAINISDGSITLQVGSNALVINASGITLLNKDWLTHKHGGVTTGGGATGNVQ